MLILTEQWVGSPEHDLAKASLELPLRFGSTSSHTVQIIKGTNQANYPHSQHAPSAELWTTNHQLHAMPQCRLTPCLFRSWCAWLPLKASCGSFNVQVERRDKSLLNEFTGQILCVLFYYRRICMLGEEDYYLFHDNVFGRELFFVWIWAFLHFSRFFRVFHTMVLKPVITATTKVNTKFRLSFEPFEAVVQDKKNERYFIHWQCMFCWMMPFNCCMCSSFTHKFKCSGWKLEKLKEKSKDSTKPKLKIQYGRLTCNLSQSQTEKIKKSFITYLVSGSVFHTQWLCCKRV